MYIQPPIRQRGLRIRPGHGLVMTLAPFHLQPRNCKFFLCCREPCGTFGEVRQEEPDQKGGKARRDALEDEQPSPGRNPLSLIHVADAVRDGAAKSPSEGSTGDNQGDAHATLVVLVPEGQVENQSRKQARLGHPQQPSHRHDLREGVASPEAHGEYTPEKHQSGNPTAGTELLEEDVGGDFEEAIRY